MAKPDSNLVISPSDDDTSEIDEFADFLFTNEVTQVNPLFALDIFICSFRKCIQHTTRGQSNFPLSKLCCCYIFIVLKYWWQNSITAHIYANCDQGIVTR